jgi:hypothetical protein
MLDKEYPQNWPAPDIFLTEIGRLTVLFGSLEIAVNVAISNLSGYQTILDWRSSVVTAHMNFKQRVDILETLCHELHKEPAYEHLKNYKNVMQKIRKAQGLRNKFLHNSIYLNEDTGKMEMSYMSARGKMKPVIQEIKIDDLKEAVEITHIASLNLHELITTAHYSPVWEREH